MSRMPVVVLTGSTRYSMLPQAGGALTGRSQVLTLWPFSQGEMRGDKEQFIDRVFDDPASVLTPASSTTARTEYEDLILTGGLPIARMQPTAADRRDWFDSYVTMVVERDVLDIRKVRQRRMLPDVLRRLAAQTAQVLNVSGVAGGVELNRQLVGDYITLLEAVFLVHRLPAFGRTLSARINKNPTVHVVDSGLAAYLLGVNSRRLRAHDLAALDQFGHVVETFVVNELIKQSGWSQQRVRFSHYRTADKQEVDLVMESADGGVVGIEVKASATISGKDFNGLRSLRHKVGGDFVAGVLVNLGQQAFRHDDGLYVVPLDRLWSPT